MRTDARRAALPTEKQDGPLKGTHEERGRNSDCIEHSFESEPDGADVNASLHALSLARTSRVRTEVLAAEVHRAVQYCAIQCAAVTSAVAR
jgi:hypothetical protein